MPEVGPLFRIVVDVNLHVPALSTLQAIGANIMGALEDLQAKAQQLVDANTALAAKVEESNAKTDQLIAVSNATKDALVALQNAGGATPEQIGAVVTQLQGAIDAASTATASLQAQDAETTQAATDNAP